MCRFVEQLYEKKKLFPIEIKYGKIETRGILTFMKKFKLNEGYIISYDKEEILKIDGKSIFVVPAFKFLLKAYL